MSKKYNFNAYAVNKYSEGIVYTFVDGTVVEIKLSSLMESDKNITLEKFQELKNASDAIFKADDKAENLKSKYERFSYETIEDSSWIATKSPENIYFEKLEDELYNAKLERFKNTKLTKKQKRRFEMLLDGKTLNEIADYEGCTHQNISASRIAIQKKYNKFFKKFKNF